MRLLGRQGLRKESRVREWDRGAAGAGSGDNAGDCDWAFGSFRSQHRELRLPTTETVRLLCAGKYETHSQGPHGWENV